MARLVKNIDPRDLKNKQIAIGISIPFNGPGVFNLTYSTKDQLKSNLVNFFLTNFGERVLNPTFGGNLRQELFEQISNGTLEDIKSNMEELISRNFPSLKITEVKVLGDADKNKVLVSVKYSVPNMAIEDEIQINFNQ